MEARLSGVESLLKKQEVFNPTESMATKKLWSDMLSTSTSSSLTAHLPSSMYMGQQGAEVLSSNLPPSAPSATNLNIVANNLDKNQQSYTSWIVKQPRRPDRPTIRGGRADSGKLKTILRESGMPCRQIGFSNH